MLFIHPLEKARIHIVADLLRRIEGGRQADISVLLEARQMLDAEIKRIRQKEPKNAD